MKRYLNSIAILTLISFPLLSIVSSCNNGNEEIDDLFSTPRVIPGENRYEAYLREMGENKDETSIKNKENTIVKENKETNPIILTGSSSGGFSGTGTGGTGVTPPVISGTGAIVTGTHGGGFSGTGNGGTGVTPPVISGTGAIVTGTPGETIVGHSPVIPDDDTSGHAGNTDDSSGHTGHPTIFVTGAAGGSVVGESIKTTPIYRFSFTSHSPYKFGDGFVGTTWVLNIHGRDLPDAWKEGKDSSSLNILTVVSDSELWIYSDLDLGGNTHKVPAYFDPPFDGDTLLNKNPPVSQYYYDYNKGNGVLTIWKDAEKTKKYGTLTFNKNKADPQLITFSNPVYSVGYYPTTKSIPLLGE